MRPSNEREYFSYALIAGAAVLLIAILVGNRMGSKTIFEANQQAQPQPAVTVAIPTAPPTASLVGREWKKSQIVRVAADPGFPDPHVTPPPTPSPRPTPRPTQTPHPVLTQDPNSSVPVWKQTYPPEPGPGADGNSVGTEPPRAGPGVSPGPTDPHF